MFQIIMSYNRSENRVVEKVKKMKRLSCSAGMEDGNDSDETSKSNEILRAHFDDLSRSD